MYTLIGDIGNTITKICLINNNNYKMEKIIYFNSVKIKDHHFIKKKLTTIFNKRHINNTSLFSSVVPNYENIFRKILIQSFKVKLLEVKNKKLKKIVKINIKNKNQIGSDRIANAIGGFKLYRSNCIILDFGTATTFDVVTSGGTYNGGVIAPGIKLSMETLSIKADKIPFFSVKKQKNVVGKNTLEALRSGFYWGYIGLINNIISKIEKETKKKYKIIFTGGYADLFNSSIIRNYTIDRNITIKGIIEIFKKNENYFNT